jgi:F-type H+-transporting ATPase subunit delta
VGRAKVLEIIIDAAGDAFSERFRGFLSVLSSNGRLTLLPQVSDLFRELREEAENRLRVKVVSAVALDEDQAGRMREALARRFDREIELDNEVDAGIIGGAVVYAGDQVIDGSLKGRLGKLANSLAG